MVVSTDLSIRIIETITKKIRRSEETWDMLESPDEGNIITEIVKSSSLQDGGTNFSDFKLSGWNINWATSGNRPQVDTEYWVTYKRYANPPEEPEEPITPPTPVDPENPEQPKDPEPSKPDEKEISIKELLERVNASISHLESAERTVIEAMKALQKHLIDPNAHSNTEIDGTSKVLTREDVAEINRSLELTNLDTVTQLINSVVKSLAKPLSQAQIEQIVRKTILEKESNYLFIRTVG